MYWNGPFKIGTNKKAVSLDHFIYNFLLIYKMVFANRVWFLNSWDHELNMTIGNKNSLGIQAPTILLIQNLQQPLSELFNNLLRTVSGGHKTFTHMGIHGGGGGREERVKEGPLPS